MSGASRRGRRKGELIVMERERGNDPIYHITKKACAIFLANFVSSYRLTKVRPQ